MPTIRKSSRAFWFIVFPAFLIVISIGLGSYFQENPIMFTREIEVTRIVPVTVEVTREVFREVVVTPTPELTTSEENSTGEELTLVDTVFIIIIILAIFGFVFFLIVVFE